MSKVIGPLVFEGKWYKFWTWLNWRIKGTFLYMSVGGVTTWPYLGSAKAKFERTGEPQTGVCCDCGYAEPWGLYCSDGVPELCPGCDKRMDYRDDKGDWICHWSRAKVAYDHTNDKWIKPELSP